MQIRRVATTQDAVALLAELGDDAQILAGGTDVMVQIIGGEISPAVLVPISQLAELREISRNGKVGIGALVTHERIANGALGDDFASLREAAGLVGGWQTQAVGTVAGNVCNASPAADTIPPLLVHDAEVALKSQSGTRSVPLEQFLHGRRQTDRRPDELVTQVNLALPGALSGDVYLKVGRRSAMEVAIVGYAMRLDFAEDGSVADARVALASVAASPIRIRTAENALVGQRLSEEVAQSVSEAILSDISPIDDLRGSANYRRQLVPGLTRRALVACAHRANVTTDLEESSS